MIRLKMMGKPLILVMMIYLSKPPRIKVMVYMGYLKKALNSLADKGIFIKTTNNY